MVTNKHKTPRSAEPEPSPTDRRVHLHRSDEDHRWMWMEIRSRMMGGSFISQLTCGERTTQSGLGCVRDDGDRHRQARRRRQRRCALCARACAARAYAAGPRGRCPLPRHPRSRSVGGRGHAAAHTGDDSTTSHHPRAEDLVKFRGQTIAGLSRTQPEPKPKPRFVACSVLFDTAFFMIQIRAWAFFLLLLEELAVVVE